MSVIGHASHPLTLKKLANEETIVIAVTSVDEVNIVACQIAKKHFNVKQYRLAEKSYKDDLQLFGENSIDIVINPENEVMHHLKELITHPGTEQIEEFADGKVNLVSVKAKKKGKLVGRALKGIRDDIPNTDAFVASIYRKESHLFLLQKQIKENDEVYFVSSSDNVDKIVNEFRDIHDDYSRS